MLKSPFNFVELSAELDAAQNPNFWAEFMKKLASESEIQNTLLDAILRDILKQNMRNMLTFGLPENEASTITRMDFVRLAIYMSELLSAKIPPEDHYDALQFFTKAVTQALGEIANTKA